MLRALSHEELHGHQVGRQTQLSIAVAMPTPSWFYDVPPPQGEEGILNAGGPEPLHAATAVQ